MFCMILYIKLNLLRMYWENINNKRKLIVSVIMNCSILCWLFFRTNDEYDTLLGFDRVSLLVIYAVIWCILMSFTLVNDTLSETNRSGIIEQIFLSSCNIRRYIFCQVLLKSIFAVMFITLIILLASLVTRLFCLSVIISFLITIFIGTFSLVGIGYIIASISLVLNYKNISLILRLVCLVIIVRTDKNMFVPFANCKHILVELFSIKRYLWNQDITTLVGFIGNSFIYYAIGYIVFAVIMSKQLIMHSDF